MIKICLPKIIYLFILPTIICSETFAQQSGAYDYVSEMVWGITKTTNSGLISGFFLKVNNQSKKKKNLYNGLEFELVEIKHPQENKVLGINGYKYIPGKENHLFSFHLSYHWEKILFRKAAQRGVQINRIISIGPAIGLETPYFIKIRNKNGTTIQKQNDANSYGGSGGSTIIGHTNRFSGLGRSKIVPGLFTRLGLSFEFGVTKNEVVGIQMGLQADAYLRKIIMMPKLENDSVFPASYIMIFFGERK